MLSTGLQSSLYYLYVYTFLVYNVTPLYYLLYYFWTSCIFELLHSNHSSHPISSAVPIKLYLPPCNMSSNLPYFWYHKLYYTDIKSYGCISPADLLREVVVLRHPLNSPSSSFSTQVSIFNIYLYTYHCRFYWRKQDLTTWLLIYFFSNMEIVLDKSGPLISVVQTLVLCVLGQQRLRTET